MSDKLIATDYNGTLDAARLEIGLGYLAVQDSLNRGDRWRAFDLFFKRQPKLYKILFSEKDNDLLETFSEVLEGEKTSELYERSENFEDDLNNFGLRAFYKTLPGKFKEKIDGDFYEGSMETFEEASKHAKTMIYTHAIEELIENKLEQYDVEDYFTEGVKGNHFATNENGEIVGVDWQVDEADTPRKKKKIGLIAEAGKLDIRPDEIVYVEDELNGVLYKLKEEGGLPIIAPSADEDVKKEAKKDDIFVPESGGEEGWREIRLGLGLEKSKYHSF
ncbi:MAG: hypothetical protein ABEK17_02045 [Candidatus Aenigmatarchaeota archaeon]